MNKQPWGWLARFLPVLRYMAFGAACVLVAVAAILLGIEKSGLLVTIVRGEVAGRLGALGGQLEIDHASLDWFQPGIELRGIGLGPDRNLVSLERVYVSINPFAQPARRGPDRIEIEGGRIRLCQELLDAWSSLRAAVPQADGESKGPLQLPLTTVRNVETMLSVPEWGDIPIGSLDALCSNDEQGRPRIEGRITPALARADPTAAIYLGAREDESGVLSVHVSTEGIDLNSEALPSNTALERWREFEASGSLKLEAHARLSLDATRPHSGELRVSIGPATFRSPTSETPIEDISLELHATCTPLVGEDWTSPRPWESRARVRGLWSQCPLEGWILFGRNAGPDSTMRAWMNASELPLQRETLAAVALADRLEATWAAVEPRGLADLLFGVELPLQGSPSFALDLACDGGAGATYRGYTLPRTGKQTGFPLPVDDISGRLVVAIDGSRERPLNIGLVDLRGAHSGGTPATHTGWGRGLVVSPKKLDGQVQRGAEFDLYFGGDNIPIDEGLRAAVEGLQSTAWIWPTFSPLPSKGGGSISGSGRIFRTRATQRPLAHFEVDLDGVDATWETVPVPLLNGHGRLSLSFDSRLANAVGFELFGTTPTSDAIVLRGRLQDDPSHAMGDAPADRRILSFEVSADNLSLRGIDRQVLVSQWPGVGRALDLFAPAGKADVRFTGARARPYGNFEYEVEVLPREVQLTPQLFNMPTHDVRGRVLVSGSAPGQAPSNEERDDARTDVRIAPLIGAWAGDTIVACRADFPSDGDDRIEVFGAGIDVSNRALVGSLRQALSTGPEDGSGFDLGTLSINGRVDLRGSMHIPQGDGQQPVSQYRMQLRDNDFQSTDASGFGLKGLRGVVVQEGQVLIGERITGLLGRTPVELRDARLVRTENGFELETRVAARALPIDAEHMRFFLDPETLSALIEDLQWRGEIDIEQATLEVVGGGGSEGRVTFRGKVIPSNTSIDIGLPLSIERASVDFEQLVFEGGHVRAWARVSELNGRLAGRQLKDARLLLTYIEPHLSVIDLDGKLEQGRLRDMGGKGGPAFSIDLQEPFPFDLGLRIENARIDGLLQGLFQSDFADQGTLDAKLRLMGNLERLTDIKGEGSLQLHDTRLWSIPVMRALFGQLGFDGTAVFESMRTRFQLSDGIISMDAINVYSPLLQLVGKGSLDLDGRLHHDLQVRYSLVDRLGPLTRLVYWVQNNLLRVEVRGDMERPKVLLKGALSFLRSGQSEERELPLPGFAPLPTRF